LTGGATARPGAYGKADEGIQQFARLVERLDEAERRGG
jgi:hypothetical protein